MDIKKEIYYTSFIFCFSFLIFIFTINQCLSLVIDAASYAGETAMQKLVFNPHHLLYHALFLYWHKMLLFFGAGNVVFNLGMLNSIFGAVSVTIIYLILKRRFAVPDIKAMLYSIVPAFNFGFWIVSVSVNVYALSIMLLLLIYYIYLEENDSVRKWMIIALLNSIAILFNQWNVIIFLVLLVSQLISKKRYVFFKKYFVVYLLTLTVPVAFVYLYIIISYENLSSVQDITHWITRYGHQFPWTQTLKRIILEAIVGTSQTIIAPYWLFSAPFFVTVILGILPSAISLAEEIFFADRINPNLALVLFFLTCLVILLMGIFLARTAFKYNKTNKLLNGKLTYFLIWMILTSVMPLFWSGFNQRYWFIQTTIAFIVMAIVNEKQPMRFAFLSRYLFFILGALIFVINFMGVMIYGTDKKNDLTYQKAVEISRVYDKDDVVVFTEIWNFGFYFNIISTDIKHCIVNAENDSLKINKAMNYFNNKDRIFKRNKLILTKCVIDNIDKLNVNYKTFLQDIWLDSNYEKKFVDGVYIDYYLIIKKGTELPVPSDSQTDN